MTLPKTMECMPKLLTYFYRSNNSAAMLSTAQQHLSHMTSGTNIYIFG